MDNCLKNYVGLKYCGVTDPKSGLWVNTLPGISTELVSAVAPKEVDTFIDLWDRMNDRAWQRIQADVSKFMLSEKKVNVNTIAYQTQRLRLKKPLALAANSVRYEGVFIQAPSAKYGKITINGLQFYSQLTGTTNIKVFDALTNIELFSLTNQPVVVGYNLLEINKEFGLNHDRLMLFVGLSAEGLVIQQSDHFTYEWFTAGSGCNECWDGRWNDDFYELRPASYDAITGFAETYAVKTTNNGISLSAELGCGVDTYLCENKKHFAVAWQHLLAAELMKEKLGSYKLNFFANTNLEMTAELRDTFTADYEKYLKLNISRIPIDGGQLCFNCEGVTGYRYDSLV